MARFAALAALTFSRLALAQNLVPSETVLGNINPADIDSLPIPTALGPPIGNVQNVTEASYDAPAVTASVISQVLTATEINTGISVATLPTGLSASTGTADIGKRSFNIRGKRSSLRRRDQSYPIDTTRATIPKGYTPAFESAQGSIQGNGYLTYKTLSSYNTTACAAACDKISSCVFFNIFYEKDPDANNNPVDVVKCSLYSMYQSHTTPTSTGSWRGKFHIIMTGSNGYNKATPITAPPGYKLENYDNAAINAPLRDKAGQLQFINAIYLDKYDPALCTAACDAQTASNYQLYNDGCNFHACTYANMYIVSDNGVPKTVVCSLYTQASSSSYAVNSTFSSPGHAYEVSNSVGLTNTTGASLYPKDPSSCSYPADVAYLKNVSGGADFCTSYLGYQASTSTINVLATLITASYEDVTTMTTLMPPQSTVTTLTVTQSIDISTVDVLTTTTTTIEGTRSRFDKRTVAAPSSVSSWDDPKVSKVCSQIATGTVTAAVGTATSTSFSSTVTNLATLTFTAAVETVTIYSTSTDYQTSTTTNAQVSTVTATNTAACPLQTQVTCFTLTGHGPWIEGKVLGMKYGNLNPSFGYTQPGIFYIDDRTNYLYTTMYGWPMTEVHDTPNTWMSFWPKGYPGYDYRIPTCSTDQKTRELSCVDSGWNVTKWSIWDRRDDFRGMVPMFGVDNWEFQVITLTYDEVTCPCS